MKYSDSGVDVKSGDESSKLFYSAARRTWKNVSKIGKIVVPFDDFTGLHYLEPHNFKDIVIGENFDGVGTKAEIAERMGKFDTLGYDLLAMVCDDAVIRGGQPAVVGNILDINKIDNKKMKALATGLEKAAKEAQVGIINGEIAELGEKIGGYGSFRVNWAASCMWLANKNRLISGKKVKVGDKIIALEEKGFRSNGLSLARRIMENHYGKEWHKKDKKIGRELLLPSLIFAKFASSLFGGINETPIANVSAMAHITGGGILGKLGRSLKPSGLGAELDNLFAPCKSMLELIKMGKIETKEAYQAWNMGNGFMIVTPDADEVLKRAKNIGINAKVAGKIVKTKEIRIATDNGDKILFNLK